MREVQDQSDAVRVLDSGETALVVEFGQSVDPAVHNRVLLLDERIQALGMPGVVETVPTFRSLMIHYDPLRIDRQALVARIKEHVPGPVPARASAATWIIPCCYDPEFAEDLAAIAAAQEISAERVVSLHQSATYRIYMYGFAPGHCYLGGLPSELAISRRESPRPPHPPGTVIIGGGMALIATLSMPTGWWLIGRTPERMFSLAREPAVFAAVGDAIRFEAIGRQEFEALEARAVAGEIVARRA